VKLKCPQGARPGQFLAITIPVEKPDASRMNEFNGPNVKPIPDTDPPGELFMVICGCDLCFVCPYFIRIGL